MVESQNLLKDMVSFQKKSFEKSYNMFESLTGETEKAVKDFLDQSVDATRNFYSQYLNSFMAEKDDEGN